MVDENSKTDLPRKRGRKPGTQKTGGRKKGVPNKLTGEVKAMILGALERAGGEKYLYQQALDNPNAFLSLVGKIVPMTVDLTIAEQLGEMTDEAIDHEIRRLAAETALVATAERAAGTTEH